MTGYRSKIIIFRALGTFRTTGCSGYSGNRRLTEI